MNGFGGFGFGHSRALLQQLLSEDPFAVFDNDPFFSQGTTFQYHARRVPPGLQASYAAQHPQYYITDEHGRRDGTYGNGATVRDIPITGADPPALSAAPRGNISIHEMDPEEEHPFVSQQRARSQHAIVEHPDDDYEPGPEPGPEPRHNGASRSRHQPKQESEHLGSHSAAMHHASRADYPPSQTTASHRTRNEPAAGSYQYFSYSSSSSSVFGNGPARSYSTTTTTHVGPDQMPRTETTVHNQTGGAETVTVSRNIGQRSRTVSRIRDSTGHEQHQDQFRNINNSERQRFEEEWQRQAGVGVDPRVGARTSPPAHSMSGSRRLQS